MNKRVYFFIAELTAVAVLRAIQMYKRDKILPKGGKVERVKGKPVYRFPLVRQFLKRGGSSTAEPQDVTLEDMGSKPRRHPNNNAFHAANMDSRIPGVIPKCFMH